MCRWIYIIRHWLELVRVAYDLCELINDHAGFKNSAGSFNTERVGMYWVGDDEIVQHWNEFHQMRRKLRDLARGGA